MGDSIGKAALLLTADSQQLDAGLDKAGASIQKHAKSWKATIKDTMGDVFGGTFAGSLVGSVTGKIIGHDLIGLVKGGFSLMGDAWHLLTTGMTRDEEEAAKKIAEENDKLMKKLFEDRKKDPFADRLAGSLKRVKDEIATAGLTSDFEKLTALYRDAYGEQIPAAVRGTLKELGRLEKEVDFRRLAAEASDFTTNMEALGGAVGKLGLDKVLKDIDKMRQLGVVTEPRAEDLAGRAKNISEFQASLQAEQAVIKKGEGFLASLREQRANLGLDEGQKFLRDFEGKFRPDEIKEGLDAMKAVKEFGQIQGILKANEDPFAAAGKQIADVAKLAELGNADVFQFAGRLGQQLIGNPPGRTGPVPLAFAGSREAADSLLRGQQFGTGGGFAERFQAAQEAAKAQRERQIEQGKQIVEILKNQKTLKVEPR
jgi:hypothetical protein